jgi:hypothetical protein
MYFTVQRLVFILFLLGASSFDENLLTQLRWYMTKTHKWETFNIPGSNSSKSKLSCHRQYSYENYLLEDKTAERGESSP